MYLNLPRASKGREESVVRYVTAKRTAARKISSTLNIWVDGERHQDRMCNWRPEAERR